MKYRQGFVTNSSSSSFILARKDEVNKETLLELIKKQKDAIDEIISCYEYIEDLDIEITQAIEKGDKDRAFDLIAQQVLRKFLNFNSDLTLDNWKVAGGEVSNESDSLFDLFVYFSGTIELDDFKITSVY